MPRYNPRHIQIMTDEMMNFIYRNWREMKLAKLNIIFKQATYDMIINFYNRSPNQNWADNILTHIYNYATPEQINTYYKEFREGLERFGLDKDSR